VLVSNSQVPYFSSLAGADTRVVVIPHGIDTEYYAPGNRRPSEVVTCLCVGQWLRDFGMLKSVAEYVWVRNPTVRFEVVGCGAAGDSLQTVTNVHITGRLSDVELLNAYQQADIMVCPLSDATANNALLEGIACGLPLVTTDVGGTRDYISEGCASFHPPGDVAGMAEAVLQLAEDRELRTKMGHESRDRAVSFSWENVTARLIDVYRSLK
jgi:glycosyltransferase involved in cell wall biosynthesis